VLDRGRGSLILAENRVAVTVAILGILWLLFALSTPNFATIANANGIVLNASVLMILACAEAIVVLTRNYEISIASVLALSAYIGFDLIARYPEAGPVLILAPVGIGALCGMANGLLVGYCRLSSVIVTIGTLSVYRGLAVIYAGGNQIEPKDMPAWVRDSLSGWLFLGMSPLVITALAVVAAAAAFFHYTPAGRKIYAVGSNPAAMIHFGIRPEPVILGAYVLCGALTGLAGFLFGARASYVVPYFAQGLEIQVLCAVVLGGVSVQGGSGSVTGAAAGALILSTLDNGLVLTGASAFARQFIYGSAIIAAVVVDSALLLRVKQILLTRRRRRRPA